MQEFACDEQVMLRKNTSATAYGECLLNSAQAVMNHTLLASTVSLLGIKKIYRRSILQRRVFMLFQYHASKAKPIFTLIIGSLLMLMTTTVAYALNAATASNEISLAQLQTIVTQVNANSAIKLTATPEVLREVNAIRTNPKAKDYMQTALQNMTKYQADIEEALQQQNMPKSLLALPLTESGYKNLDARISPVAAAGIWQIIPATAHRYGLVINDTRDDRLDPILETKAALNYLQNLYRQFNDWNLALVAYEIGADQTQQLIQQTSSRSALDLVNSPHASEDLKKYWVALNAAVISIYNPQLFTN